MVVNPSLSDLAVMVEHGDGVHEPRTWEPRPATLADLRAVLETEGAEIMVPYGHKLGNAIVPSIEVDHGMGTYLVWRIEEVDSE